MWTWETISECALKLFKNILYETNIYMSLWWKTSSSCCLLIFILTRRGRAMHFSANLRQHLQQIISCLSSNLRVLSWKIPSFISFLSYYQNQSSTRFSCSILDVPHLLFYHWSLEQTRSDPTATRKNKQTNKKYNNKTNQPSTHTPNPK